MPVRPPVARVAVSITRVIKRHFKPVCRVVTVRAPAWPMTRRRHVTLGAGDCAAVIYHRLPTHRVVTTGTVVKVMVRFRRCVARLAIGRDEAVIKGHVIPVVCGVAVVAALVAIVVFAGWGVAVHTAVRQIGVTVGHVVPIIALMAVSTLAWIVAGRLCAVVTTGALRQAIVINRCNEPILGVVTHRAAARAVPRGGAVAGSTVALPPMSLDRSVPTLRVVAGDATSGPMPGRGRMAVGTIVGHAVGEAHGRPVVHAMALLTGSAVMAGR